MPIDIKQQADGDIDLTGGDISWDESTYQHQRDILLARKGDYFNSPGVGVGLEDHLDDDHNGTAPEDLYREIRQQFTNDGMDVQKISLDEIIAEYGY